MFREILFAVLLAVGAACFVVAASLVSPALAWLVAGVAVIVLAWLLLGGDRPAPADKVAADLDVIEVGS